MTHTDEASIRRAKLTPAQRALLEKRLQAALSPDRRTQVIPLRPDQNSFPLSFAQERMWFLDQWDPANPAYNRPLALRLAGRLDVPALERTLGEILRRHEVLRATFPSQDGRLTQIVTPAHPASLPLVRVPGASSAARELEAQRLAIADAQCPLDLARGPLFQAVLYRLDEEDHVLMVVIHHIAFDAWSASVFRQDLVSIYEAFSAGQPSPLAELPIQYADYAAWQRSRQSGKQFDSQIAYWRRQLEGAPPVLELPTDHHRPPIQTHCGARETLVLPDTLIRALAALSEQEGATLFMTLLAALKLLIYRLTGQIDIVVGAPVANRDLPETERMIGVFLNNLALRSDLSGNPTFLQLLRRVRETALAAYDHQDVPFEILLEELQPERDPTRTPLFQVYFNMHPDGNLGYAPAGLRVEHFELGTFQSNYDLTLVALEQDGDILIHFVYSADLFDAATIERLVSQYQTLLDGIVAEPESSIRQLPLLTASERHQLLVGWNDTRVDFGPDLCVHQLFERQVKRTPEAVALVFQDQQLTYRQLNAQANRLAHYLQGMGAAPETLIGLFLERSVERVVAMLGILKAGAAFVSLDPADARQHLAHKVEDAKMSLIMTTEALQHRLPDGSARLICVDTEQAAVARQSSHNPASAVTPANLAYTIYTSGSTGRPKGVLIEHTALCNFLLAWYDCCEMRADTHRLDNTSLGYDVWVASITIPLCCGGVLRLAPEEVLLPGPKLIRFLQETGVSQVSLIPSAFRLLPEAELPSLRLIIAGGEVVTADLVARWAPGRTFLNCYGPTEATITTTVYECTDGAQAPPIGRPMANMQVYLLDSHLQPVPVGVPGELCIGGAGLARGYLDQPSFTAEKFIPNPFGGEPGTRLYRTGDLAHYLPDGNIHFLGRIDHQVKIRGFRIELEGIESVLAQHPAVREALLVDREVVPGDRRLAAYVVPNRQPGPTSGELNRFLKERLPDYMVPSAYILLDALPLTPSGKLDRGALPAPEWSRPELDQTHVAPRTPVESVLIDIWTQVLGIDQPGVHDNFFELGGHSLLATQIISLIRDIFQFDVPLRTVFEAPTVAGMSQAIVAMEASPGKVEKTAEVLMSIKAMPAEERRRLLQEGRQGRTAS